MEADAVSAALKSLLELRGSVDALLQCFVQGPLDDQDNADYLGHVRQRLVDMDSGYTTLEKAVASLPPQMPTIANINYPCFEPGPELYDTYHRLLQSYQWMRRVQDYSLCVGTLLRDNQLKRTGPATGAISKRTRKMFAATHSVDSPIVDQVISQLSARFPDMPMIVTRPIGASTALLHVRLGRVLKAVLALRGLVAENVVVRGYDEMPPPPTDGHQQPQIGLWQESRHLVFRHVTRYSRAALLEFSAPYQPEYALQSFVAWFHSYGSLFQAECHYCGKILCNNLPPAGRELVMRQARPFHVECKDRC